MEDTWEFLYDIKVQSTFTKNQPRQFSIFEFQTEFCFWKQLKTLFKNYSQKLFFDNYFKKCCQTSLRSSKYRFKKQRNHKYDKEIEEWIQTLLKPWRASITKVEYRENGKSVICKKITKQNVVAWLK